LFYSERCDLQLRATACTRREQIRSSWLALRGTSVRARIGSMGPTIDHALSDASTIVFAGTEF
jgi:hypothetical protein